MVTVHLKGHIKKGSLFKVKCSMNVLLKIVMARLVFHLLYFYSSAKFIMAL